MQTPDYLTIEPYGVSLSRFHSYLLGSVAPRPIGFASTLDTQGRPNLAPFSYFNVFSTRPPILILGPNRAGQTGIQKDTAINAFNTFELVVNVVSYDLVQQMNIASAPYPSGVDEFVHSGLTPIPSEKVKAFRVKESPVQLECKVTKFVSLGSTGGSGNLIISEVLLMHIDKRVLDENGNIDPRKIDLVGRMGADYYCRTTDLFELPKPSGNNIIGWTGLPDSVKNSSILTGNDLGKLAHVTAFPTEGEIQAFQKQHADRLRNEADVHRFAQELLQENRLDEAWMALLGK
jgi:flavin reductase (DIM6/NTAB) family NADH-FMN oxidoreductase RutF